MDSNEFIIYHITPTLNLSSISDIGFIPKTESPNYPPRIYFSFTIEDCVRVLVFKIGERDNVRHSFLVLRARLEGIQLFRDQDPKVSQSFYIKDAITPDRYKIEKIINMSMDNFPLGFMNMYYRNLAEYITSTLHLKLKDFS